ncbi:hypothetical protein J3F83DRAFT_582587 [Trichoderma novae-zelandiae]
MCRDQRQRGGQLRQIRQTDQTEQRPEKERKKKQAKGKSQPKLLAPSHGSAQVHAQAKPVRARSLTKSDLLSRLPPPPVQVIGWLGTDAISVLGTWYMRWQMRWQMRQLEQFLWLGGSLSYSYGHENLLGRTTVAGEEKKKKKEKSSGVGLWAQPGRKMTGTEYRLDVTCTHKHRFVLPFISFLTLPLCKFFCYAYSAQLTDHLSRGFEKRCSRFAIPPGSLPKAKEMGKKETCQLEARLTPDLGPTD